MGDIMRLHTDLTTADVHRIVREAPCAAYVDSLSVHGTRSSKARGVELKLSGSSNRARNDGSGEPAATWDEWGIVLNALFDADPTMRVGGHKTPTYDGQGDFHYKTSTRYADLTGEEQHRQHRWEWAGAVLACTGCDAEMRRA